MRVWLVAHHAVPWSTGSDLRRTLEGMGAEVVALQDEDLAGWHHLIAAIRTDQVDVVIWNATPPLSGRIPPETRREMQFRARQHGIPTVGFHLDRWWGLRREPEMYADPFFQCEYVFTADGHPNPWHLLDINHHWLPPGVAPFHCFVGMARPPYNSQLAFVGSWRRYGHYEWRHRDELVQYLQRTYSPAVTFWPERHSGQVRGKDLNDLYASVEVVVGDSCLLEVGDGPYTRFCSDRIPETLGRGGCLVHPEVPGITAGPDSLFVPGFHLATWPLGDWGRLRAVIDELIGDPTLRQSLRDGGRNHVTAWHTYDTRLMTVFDHIGLDTSDVHLWPGTVEARRRSDGETDDQTPQTAPQVPVRAARPTGVSDAGQGSRPQRQSKGKPAVQGRPLVEVLAGPDQRQGEPGAGEGPQEALSG